VVPETAAETHLPVGMPVVGGHVDGLLGVLGSGVRDPGDACMNCGTSGTFSTVCLPPLGYPMLGLQVAGSATNTSGRALDWFIQQIHSAPLRDTVNSGARHYDALLAEAAAIPPGADGLLFMPHLAGERGITRDPYSRGAWVGLTLDHDRRHLVRSLLEGVAFSFRSIQEWLTANGAMVVDVRCVGGQARSDIWNQIKADVLNRTVVVPEVIEAAAAGAAMLAALGIGGHASLEDARCAMVRVNRRFEPDPLRAELYSTLYESFCGLYPALREVNWRLHDLSRGGSPLGK
jgi:xylulokinase